jgi:hypothetical protein
MINYSQRIMVAFPDKKSKQKVLGEEPKQELRVLEENPLSLLPLWLSESKLYIVKKYNSMRMYNNIYSNFSTFSETLISIIGLLISWNLGGTL